MRDRKIFEFLSIKNANYSSFYSHFCIIKNIKKKKIILKIFNSKMIRN